MIEGFLPPELTADRVSTRIGLISDTHMPARCAALPQVLFDALRGVDLLLHAGDVGELWVLDALSAIAPVIAVHGNDETADAQRELPYQQVIAIGGQRILLTHAHYPDRAEEMASRTDDAWAPKLARRAAMGRRAGAGIVVFGHTHIPMTVEYDGVLLVNPGALACPNLESRQRIQSVAILSIRDDGAPFVTHIDLARADQPFVPRIEWGAGFRAAHQQFGQSILAPDLAGDFSRLSQVIQRVAPETGWAPYLRLAHRCWSGAQDLITRAALRDAVQDDTDIPTDAKAAMLAVIDAPLLIQ
ncbi:MAG: metallophosphoesterase family protein [Thermomicrobiales bacterium]